MPRRKSAPARNRRRYFPAARTIHRAFALGRLARFASSPRTKPACRTACIWRRDRGPDAATGRRRSGPLYGAPIEIHRPSLHSHTSLEGAPESRRERVVRVGAVETAARIRMAARLRQWLAPHEFSRERQQDFAQRPDAARLRSHEAGDLSRTAIISRAPPPLYRAGLTISTVRWLGSRNAARR